MKKNNGITLISLVITIVLMLVISVVTINFVIGKNGLFQKSEQAVMIHEKEEAKEDVKQGLASLLTDTVNDDVNLNEVYTTSNLDNETQGKVNYFQYNNGGISTVSYTSKNDSGNIIMIYASNQSNIIFRNFVLDANK